MVVALLEASRIRSHLNGRQEGRVSGGAWRQDAGLGLQGGVQGRCTLLLEWDRAGTGSEEAEPGRQGRRLGGVRVQAGRECVLRGGRRCWGSQHARRSREAGEEEGW